MGGGVYTFSLKYGLIINKICKYFGVGSQNFPLKNFSYEFDFGGVRIKSRNFRGSTDWFGRNRGGNIWHPSGADFVHPPLGVCDTFPNSNYLT